MEKQVKYYSIVADFGADGTSTFMITEDKAIAEGTVTELFPLTQRIKVKWADPPAEESTVKAHNCVKKFVVK